MNVNGGKYIKFGFGVNEGSGSVAFARSDERVLFNYVKHEISHWLLGGGHPYPNNSNATANRVASLLSGSLNRSMSVNAVERDRLGWGTTIEITTDLSNQHLGDFLTTGVAYKYKAIKSSYSNVHFYFSNHQKISIYDDATADDTDKGIFITRTWNPLKNDSGIRYLASDGDWNWENTAPYWVFSPWDTDLNDGIDSLGVFKKVAANPKSGENFMTSIRANNFNNKIYWLYAYKDENGVLDIDGYYTGMSSSDMKASFNMNYGRIFGPHTNPLPKDATDFNGTHIEDFGMIIKKDSATFVTVDFKNNYNPYSISENTTWDGQIFLDNTLTVQSGAKLTIKPNTIVYVEDSKAITVYGELDANGVEFLPMNSTWNGITFHNGSDGEIENSTIIGVHSYGGAAIKVYTDNHIEIHGNTITDITGAASGILFSSASDGYAYENHIENTSSYGIYAYNSSVGVFNNFIKGHSSAGVYSSGSSNVLFSAVTSPYYDGENTIIGGKYGLQIGSSSTLHAGNSSSFASQNRIANQSGSGWAHIYSTSYYTNYAQYNYFKPYNGSGGSAPVVGGWGPVITSPYLTTDPDPGVGFKRMVNQNEPIVFSSLDEEKLYEALELKLQSDFEAAANLFEELVKQSNSTHIVEQSLHELAWINIGVKDSYLLNRFYNIEQDLLGTQFEFDYQIEKSRLHYANNELRLALDLIESVMEFVDEIDPQKLKNATILAAHIAADLGDVEKAITFMNQAVSYKTKSLNEFMLLELQNYIDSKDKIVNESKEGYTQLENQSEIGLSNYPNPFNPNTTIRFLLPTDTHVNLVVFDVLGRKVAELLNEFRTQGNHSISFDATNLSSGIYFYHLKTNSQISIKSMSLIK